jgi:hypothetical protein
MYVRCRVPQIVKNVSGEESEERKRGKRGKRKGREERLLFPANPFGAISFRGNPQRVSQYLCF